MDIRARGKIGLLHPFLGLEIYQHVTQDLEELMTPILFLEDKIPIFGRNIILHGTTD